MPQKSLHARQNDGYTSGSVRESCTLAKTTRCRYRLFVLMIIKFTFKQIFPLYDPMKKHILLAFFAICFLPPLAISQVIEWQRTIGGSGDDELYSIRQTSDGGFILGGSSNSNISGNKAENSLGGYDYWIIKTNVSGNIEWQNTIGGGADDELVTIHETADGGFILGGNSKSDISGDKLENCNGGYDYWIVKTDAVGNIQWQNTIGGSGDDQLSYSVQQTFDKGFILGGSSKSNISGDKIENCYGQEDYWIVKLDSLGTLQWQNTIGGNGKDALLSLQQTFNGEYILGGYSQSNISGDKTENCAFEDYWIVKIDTLGNIQWQNTIGGNHNDKLISVKQTFDGGYILGGFSLSNVSGDKTENSNGWYDYWIVKTDSIGTLQWQNTIGGSTIEELYITKQTIDGGFILGGVSISPFSGDKTENCNGTYDFWVIKTDSIGNLLWQNTIGGDNLDELFSIQETSDGSYILGGYSLSNISFDKTENSNGSSDYWILKLTDKFNIIKGTLFIDLNNNSIQDLGEPVVSNKRVFEQSTGNFAFSDLIGQFRIALVDTGSFSTSSESLFYYYAVPFSHNSNFTGTQQTDSLNDFALQPAGVFNDLCVTVTPLGPFRAGFNASYHVTYENVGTTTLNPTVIFFADDDVSFVSAIPVANSVTIDSVVWYFGPLSPFQTGGILVTVNVTTGTPIGTLINSGAHIEPLANDANTICNQSYWEVFTTGSYDPNDIIVNEDTLLSTQFPNPPYLEYIIRFQNTGNDTAFTVKVLNTIDTFKLDLTTFEFIASSHPLNLEYIPWEHNMEFRLENILLPDSNTNEPGSHGFVRYRIKPKSSLISNDTIANYAAIYFDFNAPVITNTAVTHIVLPTTIAESTDRGNNLLLYPNPAQSTLTIVTNNLPGSGCNLLISDVTGRTLFSKPISAASTKHNINISSLSRGIYFVQLQVGEKISRGRFVKE